MRNSEEDISLVLRPGPEFYSDVDDLQPNIAKNISNRLGEELYKPYSDSLHVFFSFEHGYRRRAFHDRETREFGRAKIDIHLNYSLHWQSLQG